MSKSNEEIKIMDLTRFLKIAEKKFKEKHDKGIKNKIDKLLDACDKIHNGIKTKKYVNPPSDEIYERISKLVEHKNKISVEICETGNGQVEETNNQNETTKESETNEQNEELETNDSIFMGSVLKKTIDEFEKIKKKNSKLFDKMILLPKFDGISIALSITFNNSGIGTLNKAFTRGIKINGKVSNTNQTEKLNYIIEKLTTTNETLYNSTIVLRGEIVLNYKKYNNNGKNELQNASLVSGLMNGKMDNFIKSIDTLTFQAYEIGKIIKKEHDNINGKNVIFVPSQFESINILQTINMKLKYLSEQIPISRFKTFVLNINDFMKLFKNIEKFYLDKYIFNRELENPTDGIVYTYVNWQYPQDGNVFNKESYHKYAWKPSEKYEVVIKGINYQQGKTGQYSIIFNIQPLGIEGKSYQKLKIAFSKIVNSKEVKNHNLTEFKIGKDSKVLCVLSQGITLTYLETLQVDTKFEVPKCCITCGKELNYDDKHLICPNVNCPDKITQKLKFMINYLQKQTNKGLKIINDEGKELKSGFSEKKIEYCVNGGFNPKKIILYIPNIRSEFEKLSDVDKLYAVSYGGINECRKKGTYNENEFEWLNKYVW